MDKYNLYFSVKDIDKSIYNKNKETKIFDYINYSEISDVFVNNFHHLNFEVMFEEYIGLYK